MPQSGPILLDGGDLGCVRLLLRLRPLAEAAPAGSIIHVATTDPAAPIDLPAWCHLTGHEYLGPVPPAAYPTYALRTVVRPTATSAANPWRTSR